MTKTNRPTRRATNELNDADLTAVSGGIYGEPAPYHFQADQAAFPI